MVLWLTQSSHQVALHSRSTSRPTIRTLRPPTPSSIPNSTRRSNLAWRRETSHNQRVRQIWRRCCDAHVLPCNLPCCCLLLVVPIDADAYHRCLRRRFTPYKIIHSFDRSQSSMFIANSHTGPSGTVKLAKKEAAAKPAAASTKEKKPAAKVHIFRQTGVNDTR